MELIDNINKTLKDDLADSIHSGSKISIAAACFSIYAFQALKDQLTQIDELRFIFTSPTFIAEKAKKERREFYIPRLTRERSLYGTEFEIRLRNELTQKAIAKECADWIRAKVTFKSNISDKSIQGQLVVDDAGYTPINGFTTVELGCEKGNAMNTTIVKDASLAKTLLAGFNDIWSDSKLLQNVTDEIIDSISTAYNENSPEFIYFVTLYNIFNEFLEDISEDVLPNEATGFKESKIWGMLYNFQRDAALAIINKLEKFNGCILADSVGLGKTFTALAVIKYYENRNKSVLVLCPKKLANNWNTYKDNYVNNPIAADRLRYDVLYHTDLSRNHGSSNGLDLDRLNWGNYDLVVIDESHNFRNGGKSGGDSEKENRYLRLLNKVIRTGVKTKVLMLSATPVNNRFNDLKNQLALAYEGNSNLINEKLNTKSTIEEIFRQAQRAFNTWSKQDPRSRTTESLLKMLDFDFFEVLDSVTIARSRKHIEKYYDTADIGSFPERLKPISLYPPLTDLRSAINYNEIFEQLMLLNLAIYTPSHYILDSKKSKYADLFDDEKVNVGFTQANREQGIRRLMAINDVPTLIDKTAADTIEFYLISNGYVNMQRKVTDKYRMDVQMGTIAPLPAELEPMSGGIHTLIQSVYDDTVLDNMFIDGHESAIKGNPLNDNWAKKEFQALWNQINHKYAYTVSFDSNELIAKAIAHIDDKLFVSELQYTTSIGRQKTGMNEYEVDRGESFGSVKTRTQTLRHAEVCVYAKLPKGFHIPTPVGNYSPDWAIAFYEGTVKHIFFVAETKGTMESLNLRPIEQAKISCAKKLFNEMSNSQVRYHDVDSYQSLLDIMNSMV